jgi:hypothetical protein
MIGYVENNYKAIIKPKKDMHFTDGTLLPEFEYIIVLQEESINPDNKYKRSLIQGSFGVNIWYGGIIEEDFEIIKVLRERNISKEDLDRANELWNKNKY